VPESVEIDPSPFFFLLAPPHLLNFRRLFDELSSSFNSGTYTVNFYYLCFIGSGLRIASPTLFVETLE
jgi:hypothetical protein